MDLVKGIVVYFLIWWTVLFAILPLGTEPRDADASEGGWRGAPRRPALLRKALLTTMVAAVVWIGIDVVVSSPWLSFRSGWLALPEN